MSVLANFVEGVIAFIAGLFLFAAWIIIGLPIILSGIVFFPTNTRHLFKVCSKTCDKEVLFCRHRVSCLVAEFFVVAIMLGTLIYFSSTPSTSFWLWFSRVSAMLLCTNLLSGIYELGRWRRGKIAKDEADYKAKLEAHRAQGGVSLPPPEPWPEPRKPTS